MTVSIRRARIKDIDFLHALTTHDDVDPFLAQSRDRSREALVADVERSDLEPDQFGRFVIEVGEERAGTVTFERVNMRSEIAELRNLAVHPSFRGRQIGVEASRLLQRHLIRELGFHRIQLEVYGFNERAQTHAARAGFVREGVRRRAYRHGDGWTDGILFGLVAEDLDADPSRQRSRTGERDDRGSTSPDPSGMAS